MKCGLFCKGCWALFLTDVRRFFRRLFQKYLWDKSLVEHLCRKKDAIRNFSLKEYIRRIFI